MSPSSRPADAGPRQRRKEARPQELLEAALALFVEKGFAATRTEEVARQAGVSKGTLYLYYPSKEELFKAVVRHNLSSLIAEGAELAAQFEGSSSDLLSQLMQTWWQRIGNTPAAGIHKIVLAEVRTRSSSRPTDCSATRCSAASTAASSAPCRSTRWR